MRLMTRLRKSAGVWLVVVALGALMWQARQDTWNYHMQVDVWVFWERVEYWLGHNHSFAGLTGNEILPSTLIYVFTPLALIPDGWADYNNYLPVMILVNLVVIGLHSILVKKKNMLFVSLLFLGPILLFRFDATVTLLILLACNAFVKEKYEISGVWLGLATGMKVFPVIFLPYMVMVLVRQKKLEKLLRLLVYFGEALLLPVALFMLLGGSLGQIGESLAFHGQKLISIESVPGSMITGWSLLVRGWPPSMIPGNGIWAVEGPAEFFNRFWMLPIGWLYYTVWRTKSLSVKFDWRVPVNLVLIFLVFSKNLNPQYVWWYMALLPMIEADRVVWALTLGVALLNQLVYPVFYTTLIDNFYQHNEQHWIYYLLVLRNMGLVAVAYLTWKNTFARSRAVRQPQ